MDVITIGSATRDVFARSEDIKIKKGKEFATGKGACFALGSKLNLEEVNFFVGGGAINTAVTFANQGLKVAAIASVGRDPEGEHILQKSAKYGIHCDFLAANKDYLTSFSFILSLPDGSRTIFRYKGASWHLKESDIPWKLLQAKWLYVNHMAGQSDKVLPRVLKEAKAKGISIAWNPGSTQLANPKRILPLLKYADVFMVNQEEAAALVGLPYEERKEIFQKLNKLVRGVVIMTRGAKGVEVSDGEIVWSAGVLPLPSRQAGMKKLVDRTGAGDAFGAGFVTSFIKNPNNVEQAIQLASANATAVLTEWGANHGLLRKSDSPTKYGRLKIRRSVL